MVLSGAGIYKSCLRVVRSFVWFFVERRAHRSVESRQRFRPMAAGVQLQAFVLEPHFIARRPRRRLSSQMPSVETPRTALRQLRGAERNDAFKEGLEVLRS